MNPKQNMIITSIILCFLLTACGSIPIPNDLTIPTGIPTFNLPTINPPTFNTPQSQPPASTAATAAPIPVSGDSRISTMLLYGLIALLGVIVLFGFFALLRRPDRRLED